MRRSCHHLGTRPQSFLWQMRRSAPLSERPHLSFVVVVVAVVVSPVTTCSCCLLLLLFYSTTRAVLARAGRSWSRFCVVVVVARSSSSCLCRAHTECCLAHRAGRPHLGGLCVAVSCPGVRLCLWCVWLRCVCACACVCVCVFN